MRNQPKTMFNLRFFHGYKLNENPNFCYLTATTTIRGVVNMVMSMSPKNRECFVKLLKKKMNDADI